MNNKKKLWLERIHRMGLLFFIVGVNLAFTHGMSDTQEILGLLLVVVGWFSFLLDLEA